MISAPNSKIHFQATTSRSVAEQSQAASKEGHGLSHCEARLNEIHQIVDRELGHLEEYIISLGGGMELPSSPPPSWLMLQLQRVLDQLSRAESVVNELRAMQQFTENENWEESASDQDLIDQLLQRHEQVTRRSNLVTSALSHTSNPQIGTQYWVVTGGAAFIFALLLLAGLFVWLS